MTLVEHCFDVGSVHQSQRELPTAGRKPRQGDRLIDYDYEQVWKKVRCAPSIGDQAASLLPSKLCILSSTVPMRREISPVACTCSDTDLEIIAVLS